MNSLTFAASAPPIYRKMKGTPARLLEHLILPDVLAESNVAFTRSGSAVVAGTQAYLVEAGPGVVRYASEAMSRTRITALRPTAFTCETVAVACKGCATTIWGTTPDLAAAGAELLCRRGGCGKRFRRRGDTR
jgi:hypothetical protein